MPKNVVIFSDGTGQDGGVRPEQHWSNIYKLYRNCRIGPETAIDAAEQVTFYDPGLGTETSATGWTGIGRRVRKLLANVDGSGITVNIADCYEFIINHFQPGDRVFLFGFSRGAYTARSVANLMMLCGVPTKNAGEPLMRFRRETRLIAEEAVTSVLEHGAGHPRKDFEDERLEMARRFRERYGSHHPSGEVHRSNEAPYFIGVFDTVAALGAQGVLRRGIQSALFAGAFVLGSFSGVVAGAVAGLVSWLLGGPFLWIFGGATFFGAFLGCWLLWRSQNRRIRKTIHDYPTQGQSGSHLAAWKGEHFDRLLSRYVSYARSANAIDENRADFARVGWANTVNAPEKVEGVTRLDQVWFAGNHSDIGGSYPESESRLSDIPLEWMIREAMSPPHPLRLGPVYINGKKLSGTGKFGIPLHLRPAASGLQHCEVAGMSDTVSALVPGWVRSLLGLKGWKVKQREIKDEAPLHPTVLERFSLDAVPQCAGRGPYRPEALRNHNLVAHYFVEQD
ncbi:MAG: DUF2235 domain-containing protein [Mesorhizobium sp.]|uniref:DUF2235 domain-containing protein n=1 Tax=Mesorhizobium sp. TaxID=1871066 RepID=UPI000FE8AAFC|nr:DUF2235 domain-containing protein [Mesorhizobium sp.]RWP12712.1 MAG: DUF2235 domain-containing protein [Mesorhizobium sp.]